MVVGANRLCHTILESIWCAEQTCEIGFLIFGLGWYLQFTQIWASEVVKKFENKPIFLKIHWDLILRTFYVMVLFHWTSGWGWMAMAWPPIRSCNKNVSPFYLYVLMGYVIPYWKEFAVLNKYVRADFWFWALACICGLCKCKPLRGQKMWKLTKFSQNRPPWNQFLRTIYDMALFHRTSPWPSKRPFTRNAPPLWSLVLMSSVTPFWKKLHNLSKCLRADFLNELVFHMLPKENTLRCPEVGLYDILAS